MDAFSAHSSCEESAVDSAEETAPSVPATRGKGAMPARGARVGHNRADGDIISAKFSSTGGATPPTMRACAASPPQECRINLATLLRREAAFRLQSHAPAGPTKGNPHPLSRTPHGTSLRRARGKSNLPPAPPLHSELDALASMPKPLPSPLLPLLFGWMRHQCSRHPPRSLTTSEMAAIGLGYEAGSAESWGAMTP